MGWPDASNAQPWGIDSPFFAATKILPRATADNDISITKGSLALTGKLAAIGFVPKIAFLPPTIGIAAGVLPNMIEI